MKYRKTFEVNKNPIKTTTNLMNWYGRAINWDDVHMWYGGMF